MKSLGFLEALTFQNTPEGAFIYHHINLHGVAIRATHL
jgi:hypothetical protein